MLLGFGAKNFCSFKEGFEVSLENKTEVLTVLGIKGANASGKTNVIRTLSFIKAFIMSSFTLFEPDEGILIKSFFESDEPTDMYIHFKIDDLEYKYEVTLTKKTIIKEMLSRKDKRWTNILVRESNKIKECISELSELETINLSRTNASIVSIAHQYGLKELDTFYNFVENIGTNVGYYGKFTNDEHFLSYSDMSKVYFDEKDMLDMVGAMLCKADTGIEAIEIIKYKNEKNDDTLYEPYFKHKVDGKEKNYLMMMNQQA